MSTMNINMDIPVDLVDLWEKVWGSDGAGITYWCDMIRQPDGSDIDLWVKGEDGYLVGNPQDFKLHLAEEDEWKTITLRELAAAYLKAKYAGVTHCGGDSLDDDDACVGDLILQYALFNEIIYG